MGQEFASKCPMAEQEEIAGTLGGDASLIASFTFFYYILENNNMLGENNLI